MKKVQRKFLFVYNPLSGKGISDETLNEYKKILETRGIEADFVATEYSNHATDVVVNADNYDVVFAIGGDGTLNEVVKGNYLREDKLTICPLPNGTCNDVASMLGYGKNPIDNLNMALDGEVHNIDIGTINDDPFAYVVGMGKLMNIPYETKSVDKRKIGYTAYLKEALNEIIGEMKCYKAEIVVDDRVLDGNYSLIMVSNADHIAGIDKFYKDICLNDGEMEVLLCKASNKKEFIKGFVSFFLGKKSKDIISLKAHNVSIKLLEQPDKKWCIDGECYAYEGEQYNIKIKEKMKILAPKNKTKKLFRNKIMQNV